MPDAPDPEGAANQIAQMMAMVGQSLEPITEAAIGYRARLMGIGFDPASASAMAADYHAAAIQLIRNSW